MELTFMQLVSLATPVLAIGGAWQGAKVALNGTRERVKLVEANALNHEEKDEERHVETVQRLTSIETKLDMMLRK
jgi:hypothetical protein